MMMSGEREPEMGVVRRGRGARIGALPQSPVLPAGTVRSAVCDGLDGAGVAGRSDALAPGHGRAARHVDRSAVGRAEERVAFAALLAREWDALILDEPTNHLDLDAIAYLEEWLAAYPGGLLLVTHDRHVLDRVTNKVLEIDRGATYLHVPQERHGRIRIRGVPRRSHRTRGAGRDGRTDAQNLTRRELAWLRRGAPARTSKPKARIDAATALLQRGPAGERTRG